ncbi:MAG: hypothetical protein E7391_06760 [Ruminococcaceae bacterium]|nr:hypothetical protein [Oscillospiraceae bacterium]
MKNNKKATRIDELHSNMALVTSMLSLIALTFVTFLYNAFYQLFPNNLLLVSSVISWVIGVLLIFPMNKKDVFYFEYAIFFVGLALGLYALHGISLLSITYSFYITMAFLVAYWIYTLIIHCFVLPSKLYSKVLANILVIALAIALPAIMAYVYSLNANIPGYSIWM